MSLIRDMLGVSPATAKAASHLNENVKKESKTKKPSGVKREVYSLCDSGVPPQSIGVHGPFTKQKIVQCPVSRWKMMPFINPARSDHLKLQHWCKETDSTLEYPFAKCNFTIKIPKYNDALYNKELMKLDSSWTKEETDYLWELCERFDLRFHVIYDRYDPSCDRSIEQIKHRYYTVAKRIVEVQFDERIRQETAKHGAAGEQKIVASIKDEKTRQPLVKFTYSVEKDQERRSALDKQYQVSDSMRKMEAQLSEEIKNQELRLKKNEKKRDEMKKLKKRFELPEDSIIPISLRPQFTKPCTTVASAQLEQFRASVPKRFNDQIDVYLSFLSVKTPLVFSQSVIESYCSLRMDVAILLNLKKKIERMRKENEYWQSQVEELNRHAKHVKAASQSSPSLHMRTEGTTGPLARANAQSPQPNIGALHPPAKRSSSQKSAVSGADSGIYNTATFPNIPEHHKSKVTSQMPYLSHQETMDPLQKSSAKKLRKSKNIDSNSAAFKEV